MQLFLVFFLLLLLMLLLLLLSQLLLVVSSVDYLGENGGQPFCFNIFLKTKQLLINKPTRKLLMLAPCLNHTCSTVVRANRVFSM